MEQVPYETPTGAPREERLSWHKPLVKRLAVALDTRFETGSNTDFQDTGSYTE
jgi:hypothetical protein